MSRVQWSSYAAAVLACIGATALAWLFFGRDQLADVVMVYLLGVVLVAMRFSMDASVCAALLAVVAFNFWFIPPYLTLAVDNLRHAVTFAVMLLVAIVISGLAQRIRKQATVAENREIRTAALYALSRELSAAQRSDDVVQIATRHLEQEFDSWVSVYVPTETGKLVRVYATHNCRDQFEADMQVIDWVWSQRGEASKSTAKAVDDSALYLPLLASRGVVGVLLLKPRLGERFDDVDSEQRQRVAAFGAQMAMALERAALADETRRARLQVETEQLRSSLLSSVSHDLRTPLAVITGSASTLLQTTQLSDGVRRELTETIIEESERLNRLIRNLLDMTRIESGVVQVHKEWLPLEELIGAALNRVERCEAGVSLPDTFPLVPCDGVLIEQVLVNLFENAVKYTSGPIEITANSTSEQVVIEVADRGPGITAGEEQRIFEKFHRANNQARSGVGLGLAICCAIVTAHGGRIWAENRAGGGACFCFTLPIEGEPPQLSDLEAMEHAEREAQL